MIFQRHFRMEEYGLLTVTDVEVTPDLKYAKIFFSMFGNETQRKAIAEKLEEQKGFVRSLLAKALTTRSVPAIAFHLDDTMDHAMRLESIFKKIHDNDSKLDS